MNTKCVRSSLNSESTSKAPSTTWYVLMNFNRYYVNIKIMWDSSKLYFTNLVLTCVGVLLVCNYSFSVK